MKTVNTDKLKVRSRENFLVFGSPIIEQAEINEVVASMTSGWLGTGPKVAQFEENFKNKYWILIIGINKFSLLKQTNECSRMSGQCGEVAANARETLCIISISVNGLPSDTEASLLYLKNLFPGDKFEDRLPPIIVKHQLYSIVKNMTVVDKHIVSIEFC